MADSRDLGVVDYRNRTFYYKNMYVCDGSVVAANLGVNPSLTITALAERAMNFIPPVTRMAWNDAAPPKPRSHRGKVLRLICVASTCYLRRLRWCAGLFRRASSNSATRFRRALLSALPPWMKPFVICSGDAAAERTSLNPLCSDSCTFW